MNLLTAASAETALAPNAVSIIIPIKNGLPYFRDVCTALKTQIYDAPVEVICIDSGSKDGSDQIVLDHGFRLVRIPSVEFGHGRTRNKAASLSGGEYLVFLTHDAIPNSPHWLAKLVEPMRRDPAVAGVFSRHIAHEGADPFTRWELQQHFSGLSNFAEVQITDRARYDADPGLRQVYHFYSDNASAMPRRIWEKYPYPDVQFAEDQIWAKTIIEAGYKKAFAIESVVRHSHSFGPWKTLCRSFDESRAFNKLFGYNLCTSPRNLARSTAYLFQRDLGNALKYGWWRSHPLKTTSKIFESFTRPLGHYLGCHNGLPKWIENWISRDDWIKAL